jgi:hypothetical protein
MKFWPALWEQAGADAAPAPAGTNAGALSTAAVA